MRTNTNDFDVVMDAVNRTRDHLESELKAVKLALESMPTSMTAKVREEVQTLIELVSDLTSAAEYVDEARDKLIHAERTCDLNIRRQKLWRILACRACIGGAKISDLIQQAFFDLIREPPSEEELDKQLHAVTERLEEMERAETEFGHLRPIDIDGDR